MHKLPPLHPGEVLREEFMEPLGLTPYALAARLTRPKVICLSASCASQNGSVPRHFIFSIA
jgi:hypothetical protein